MNKAELVAAMSAKTGESKKVTEETLNAFVEVVSDALKGGDKIQLVGFGSFEARRPSCCCSTACSAMCSPPERSRSPMMPSSAQWRPMPFRRSRSSPTASSSCAGMRWPCRSHSAPCITPACCPMWI